MMRCVIASFTVMSTYQIVDAAAAAAAAADRCLLQVQASTEKTVSPSLQSQGIQANKIEDRGKTVVPGASSSVSFGSDDAGFYAHTANSAYAHDAQVADRGDGNKTDTTDQDPHRKPSCADFHKNGVGPVSNSNACASACRTVERLLPGSYTSVEGGGKCSCRVSSISESRRTLCTDYGVRTAAPVFSLLALLAFR
eukprot:TRINITY_DN41559_c0_g1_i1.p1 TRINITY_DN41559_c0_g1~~TRINITY_DN41559_c0_g1_i1.p1  ORF type:complete len:196 (-),score=23.02 TRINITY_DN41559_c0_g1_i1:176-763(-)